MTARLAFYFLMWFVLLGLAILNATVREFVYARLIGELRAQQLSTLFMMCLVFGFTWLVHQHKPLSTLGEASAVGIVWAMATALFEALMIVVLMGKPIAAVVAQYDLTAGDWWPLLLISILATPPAVWILQRH